jgi:hypothetical protein
MNLLPEQIERSSDQAQHAGKQESRSNGFPCAESGEKQQGWNGKAPPTDPGQPDSHGNEESDKEVHLSWHPMLKYASSYCGR